MSVLSSNNEAGRGKKIFEGLLTRNSGGWDTRELNTVPSRDGRSIKLRIGNRLSKFSRPVKEAMRRSLVETDKR
jgi:hypothetical protein